jgi:hypothetical protein
MQQNYIHLAGGTDLKEAAGLIEDGWTIPQ